MIHKELRNSVQQVSENVQELKKSPRWRLTTLVFLVLFVFVILLVSVLVSGIVSYLLFRVGFIPPLYENRFPILLAFMLLISLGVGTLLTVVAGSYSLRPLHKLIEATKEVASGNFQVRVEESGSEEFKRLAVSFNDMTKELNSIETLRSDFVHNISHEFKTPIVSIGGFARLLKKDTLSAEQRQEYLDIIISEAARLSRLSSNVLLLSNLENTERIAEQSPFSLDEQIRRTILLFEPELQRKQLKMDINLASAIIAANEETMQQVWINLLANAIKFTNPGGVIGVRLQVRDNTVFVSVSDTGMGMTDEVKAHLFEKFYQGDPSRSSEGNGLGLSLVKRILELSGGTISLDSTLGAGSCFTLSFPLAPT